MLEESTIFIAKNDRCHRECSEMRAERLSEGNEEEMRESSKKKWEYSSLQMSSDRRSLVRDDLRFRQSVILNRYSSSSPQRPKVGTKESEEGRLLGL